MDIPSIQKQFLLQGMKLDMSSLEPFQNVRIKEEEVPPHIALRTSTHVYDAKKKQRMTDIHGYVDDKNGI